MKKHLFFWLLLITSLYAYPNRIEVKHISPSKYITFKFLKPVSGYKIVIVWHPTKQINTEKVVGPATMELTDIISKKKYVLNYQSLEMDGYINNLKVKNDLVTDFTIAEYTISYVNLNEKPFYIFDINFDGKKELIISEYGLNKFDESKKNKIFEFNDGKLTDISSYEPFKGMLNFSIDKDEIGFHDGFIDVKNKEIIVTDQLGCCQSIDHVFGIDNEQTIPQNRFIEIRTEDNDWQTKPGYDIVVIHIKGKKDQTKQIKSKTP